jgi:hypothetical protein
MPLRVFVAGPWREKDRARLFSLRLRALGIEVLSDWVDEPPAPYGVDNVWPLGYGMSRRLAEEYLVRLRGADLLIAFSGHPSSGGGGRHVELGAHLVARKEACLIGEPEHLFHAHPLVSFARTEEDALTWIAAKIAQEIRRPSSPAGPDPSLGRSLLAYQESITPDSTGTRSRSTISSGGPAARSATRSASSSTRTPAAGRATGSTAWASTSRSAAWVDRLSRRMASARCSKAPRS